MIARQLGTYQPQAQLLGSRLASAHTAPIVANFVSQAGLQVVTSL